MVNLGNKMKLSIWIERILQENHNPVDMGYLGQYWMMELIKRNYLWPEIKNNVKNYLQGCFKCQQNKMQHMKKAGELHPLETLEGLWQEISINIIGPLPKSNKKNAIIVIVNQFIKMIWLKMATTNILLGEIAKIYWDDIWKLHGVPKKVLSNREP